MQEQKRFAQSGGKYAQLCSQLPLQTLLLNGLTPEHVDSILNSFQIHQEELKKFHGVKSDPAQQTQKHDAVMTI